ncbi:MAG: lysophospholipid acyltransferase family protein [Desulfobacterales bacterium]|nr:lysophospholipid acyltransferase family protein [Desulfobacterales bacterium]
MKGRLSGFLQSKFNVYLCLSIGWKWARIYVRLLGALYFLFRQREKKLIKKSIGIVFASEKGFMELRRIQRGVMAGIVHHYYEKLFNAYCSDQASRRFFQSRVMDEGLIAVKEALSAGRGALIVTGHYGGVEFIPGYIGYRGIPVSIVVRFSSDRLRRLSCRKGKRFNIRIIDADRTPNVLFAICRDLKENRVVITQCDEIDEWRPDKRGRIFFLGRRTAPDRALNLLVRRACCPVIFCVMHRDPGFGYRFIARCMPETEAASGAGAGAAGLKFIEALVYRYPHQWYQWPKFPAIQETAGAGPAPAWTVSEPPWASSLGAMS